MTERYGKKYGWIGFYTYAGMLDSDGRLPKDDERLSDVPIDPSFPESPPALIDLPISGSAQPLKTTDAGYIRVSSPSPTSFYIAPISAPTQGHGSPSTPT